MAKTFQVSIVSADRELFSGAARMIAATAVTGELGILPGHVPLLAVLKPGQLRLHLPDDGEEILYVSGGFIEVQRDLVIILADEAERAEELDIARIEEAHRRAEARMREVGQGSIDYEQALVELEQAAAQLAAVRRIRK